MHPNRGDTRGRILYQKLIRVDLYKYLVLNRTQLYSMQETCMHVAKIARFDWLTVFSAGVVMFVVKVSYTRNLYELASNFHTRNLCNFLYNILVQDSSPCVTAISKLITQLFQLIVVF